MRARVVLLALGSWFASLCAASPVRAEAPISELEVDFAWCVGDRPASARPGCAKPLAEFAAEFRRRKSRVEEARALGFLAVEQLRAGEAAVAAETVQRSLRALPAREQLLRSQIWVLAARVAEREQRLADALNFYVRSLEQAKLGFRGKPAPADFKRELALSAQLMAQGKHAEAAEAYERVSRKLVKAATEFGRVLSDLSAARARAGDPRAALRVGLEYQRRGNRSGQYGLDADLSRALQSMKCEAPGLPDERAILSWSVAAMRARALSGAPSPLESSDPKALSGEGLLQAWLGSESATAPDAVLERWTAIAPCFGELRGAISRSALRRVLEPKTHDEELRRFVRVAAPSVERSRGVLRLSNHMFAHALARLSLRATDVTPAVKVQLWRALEHLRGTGSGFIASDGSLRVELLQRLASSAKAAERGRVLAALARESKARRAALAAPATYGAQLAPARQSVARAEQQGPDEYQGSAATAATLLNQLAAQFGPLTDAAERATRLAVPLGIARAYDLLGDTSSADRLRAEVESALGADRGADSLFLEALLGADLSERARREGNRQLETEHLERSALAWARMLSTEPLPREFDAGQPTSLSPALVFERAIQRKLEAGQARAAFQLVELARALQEPLRSRARDPGVSRESLQARLTALETAALQHADPAKKAKLEGAIAAAHKQSRPQTALVSPLATARLRLQAIRGFVPDAALAPVQRALEQFEADYQELRSQEVHREAELRAVAAAKEAEARARAGDGSDVRPYRQRAEAQLLAARMARATEIQSPLTFRHFTGIAALQAALDDDTALVSYWLGREAAAAFVVTRASFRATPLSALTEASTRALVTRAQGDDPTSLRALYDHLVAPIRDQLNAQSLLIVANDVLGVVPFEALGDGASYWFEQHALRRISHVGEVLSGRSGKRRVRRVLAVSRDVPGRPRLEGAALETESISRRLSGATSVTIDKAVTEATLKAELGRSELVHVAAHSELVPELPQFSRLLVGAGLGQDGALEAREVAEMPLAGLELVVLSACETAGTGRGQLPTLARAFLAAGAGSVVATLWPVDDRAAAPFMDAFYAALARGQRADLALNAARSAVLRGATRPHLRDWAAFVLIGGAPELAFVRDCCDGSGKF